MNDPSSLAPGLSQGARSGFLFRGLLLLVAASTVLAAVLATPSPLLAILPVAIATATWVVVKVPLRWSCSALIVLMLFPDTHVGSVGQWRSPLAGLGDAMIHGAGLPISGAEALALLIAGVALYRAARGSLTDPVALVGPPKVVINFMVLAVAAVLYADLLGVLRGLPVAPWKVRLLLQPMLFSALFLAAFREQRDHLLIGRIVVAAACFKSLLAFVVQWVAVAQTGGPFSFATSHGESVLFGVAVTLVLTDLVIQPSRHRLLRAAVIVPIILLGAIENGRRTFWVMLLGVLLAGYLAIPMHRWKRTMTRAMVLAVPIIALYVAIGWERTSTLFAPVQTLRGIVDSSASRSSYWRDVENWNVATSMRDTPLAGAGLGGQYTEHMANDDISMFYKEYREWPHNSLLGIAFLMGPFGFTAYFALLSLVCFLSLRSLWRARAPELRVAAFACLGTIIVGLVQAYGDLGLNFPQYKILVALAVAVSARLAVVTGAWPARTPRAA